MTELYDLGFMIFLYVWWYVCIWFWSVFLRYILIWIGTEQIAKKPLETGHDTVGAVCLDYDGNIAYATSTGGINAKLPGRCGDSPIIGL